MRSWCFVSAALAVGLVAACSNGSPEPTDPSSTSPSETTDVEPTEPSETEPAETQPPEDLAFDCGAVATAQQALGDAATTELERLAIDRSAPEAFTVVLLVTSQGAPEYWEAIEGATQPAAGPDLRSDVELVADYWAALDDELAAIEIPDSSAASVQAAGAELAAISQSAPDAELAPTQQRVQDELAATCGAGPADPSTTTSS